MIRLFVALSLPPPAVSALAGLGNGVPGARWVPAENYHVTLRFIGNVEGHVADDVCETLERIDAGTVDIDFDGLTWFGTKKKPTSIVARVAKNEGLLHLQRKVESAVVRSGLPPEDRKFMPHVTLARLKGANPDAVDRYCAERSLVSIPSYTAESFVLYSSFLSQSGAIYTPEVEFPLRAYATC